MYVQIKSVVAFMDVLQKSPFVTIELIEARDNMILQIIGFLMLYSFLFLMLHHVDLATGVPHEKKTIERRKIDSKTKDKIYVLSVSVWFIVFLGYFFGNLFSGGVPEGVEGFQWFPNVFLTSSLLAIAASVLTGLIIFLMVSYTE